MRFLSKEEVWEFSQGLEHASLAIQKIRSDIINAMDHVHSHLFSIYLREAGHVAGALYVIWNDDTTFVDYHFSDNIQFKDETDEYKRRHGVINAASVSIDEYVSSVIVIYYSQSPIRSDMIQYSAFDPPSIDKLPPLVVGAEGFDDTNTLQRSLYPVVVRLDVSANALNDDLIST